jgi:Ca2+-binding RTX toxin-like protein
MEESKGRRSRRHRVATALGLEYLEGRRLMAAGGAQVGVGEVTASDGTTELIIRGTNRADVINVEDNGTGQAGNVTVTLGDGASYTSQGAITQIQVLGRGGDDQVSYDLAGDLVATRTVQVDLGAGNDQFTARLDGAIANAIGLDLEAYGDSGSDNLSVVQAGPTLAGTDFVYLEGDAGADALSYTGTGVVAAGASVLPALSGGAGNDTLTSNYAGQIDGNYIYNLAIDGGAGSDTITDNIAVGAGSTGTVGSGSGTPAAIQGGAGNDQIRFAVAVDPAAQVQVDAVAIGGAGKDAVQRTSNVQGSGTDEADSLLG